MNRRVLWFRNYVLPSVAVISAIIALCWPTFLNGGGFFFPDSSYYLRSADAAVRVVTGFQSDWSDKFHTYTSPSELMPAIDEGLSSGVAAPAAHKPLHPVLMGRSIYYGLTILPFIELFGSVGVAILQAALAVFVIWVVGKAFGVDRRRLPSVVLAIAVILSVTSLPLYVSLIMPDVFGGFSIALAASALVGWSRFNTIERAGLAMLLCLSGMAHSSHTLILLGILIAGLLLRLANIGLNGIGLAIVFSAITCGISGERIYAFAVTHQTGSAPIRPPYLTARLIDAGPGLAMLQGSCGSRHFEACRYLDRMPRDSDTFLWSSDPREGVFSVESHDVQRRLAWEDSRFASATLQHDPFAVFRVSAAAALSQITLTELNIFNAAPPSSATHIVPNLPPSYAREVRASRYYSRTFPVEFMNLATTVSSLVAVGFLALMFLRRQSSTTATLALVATGLFLFGVATNAAVAGALSKPHDRYNTRVLWVLPLGAIALLAARRERNHRGESDAVN